MENKIKFILDGCDISFTAIAPKDITLEQLLKQCDKIKPDWCGCGICSGDFDEEDAEIIIDYDSIKKRDDSVSCSIKEQFMEEKERYELIGYCSYRDTETGVVGDNFVDLLKKCV